MKKENKMKLKLQFFAAGEVGAGGVCLDNYGGIVQDIRGMEINLADHFNTNRLTGNSETTKFLITTAAKVTEGNAANISACGRYPINCNELKNFELTATNPWFVNEEFQQCVCDMEENIAMEVAKQTARELDLKSYNYAIGELSNVAVVVDAKSTTVFGKIAELVRNITKVGYSTTQIHLELSEDLVIDMALEEMSCCDGAIQSGKPGSTTLTKLQFASIAYVPVGANVDFEMMAYIKDWAPYHELCSVPLYTTSLETDGTIGKIDMLKGKGKRQAGYIEPVSTGMEAKTIAKILPASAPKTATFGG